MQPNKNLQRKVINAKRKSDRLKRLLFKTYTEENAKKYKEAFTEYEGMIAIKKEVESRLPEFTPEAALSQWDNIEIEAITLFWNENSDGTHCIELERTDDPLEILFYSVYLHQADEGGVQCIADLPTKEAANDFANFLQNAVANFKDNGYLDTTKPFGSK